MYFLAQFTCRFFFLPICHTFIGVISIMQARKKERVPSSFIPFGRLW